CAVSEASQGLCRCCGSHLRVERVGHAVVLSERRRLLEDTQLSCSTWLVQTSTGTPAGLYASDVFEHVRRDAVLRSRLLNNGTKPEAGFCVLRVSKPPGYGLWHVGLLVDKAPPGGRW